MKNRWIIAGFCLILSGAALLRVGLPAIKDFLIKSPIADVYIYMRDGKSFDPDHVITKLDNGMSIIVNKHDRYVCRFVRLTGHWDSNETRVLTQIIKRGFTIVEVGANFGAHTLKMAELVGKEGKIYAFEANPKVSKYLKESVALNKLESIVDVFEKAAGDAPGKAFLDFGLNNIGAGHIVTSPLDTSVGTEIVRLDDILPTQRIDLLKMDAEGYELKILQGAKNLIDRNLDHIIIMMEYIPSLLERQGSSAKELLGFLKEKGFCFWKIGRKHNNESSLIPISSEELLKMQPLKPEDVVAEDIVASKCDILLRKAAPSKK
jgi:FkbM family methyltransferase